MIRVAALVLTLIPVLLSAAERPSVRELGITPGTLEPGPLNAITDVAGIKVGQVTIQSQPGVHTGVTAILPHGGNLFREKVPGGIFIGNAFGKLAGSAQVAELGTIETPIVLTNTLAVGTAVEGIVAWTLAQSGNENVRSVNALVGETNDGGLNDIRGGHVTRKAVTEAIDAAKGGAVAEGSVGAGTGTIAFGWKGGIGTSSRRVVLGESVWTVGVLVQSNFGGRLTIGGVPIWRSLMPESGARKVSADGSCMIVIATDAPLDARNLERLAARGIFAMARTGSTYSNGSGDFAIAFSTHPGLRVTSATAPQPRTLLPSDAMSPLFEATLDATEEAIYDSLLKATDASSPGRTVRAIPVEELKTTLRNWRLSVHD